MNKPLRTNMRTRGAVIVTRVSTGDQDKHGSSPESQLDACRVKALSIGLPIIAEYYDGGVSGAFLLSRQGMQAALADIKEGRADTLITFNIDRYSRDREHQEQIKKAVRAAGGRLVFTDADYTDNAAGNLSFNIRGDMAVFEREHFRERSMLGKMTFAERGIQTARCLSPYGYHVPTNKDVMRGLFVEEQVGHYFVADEQAAIVRRIFACYAGGTHSMHRLCLELNAEGIPTPRGASAWRPATIKAILANPVHKGQPAYGKGQYRKSESRLSEISPLTGLPFRCPVVRQANDPSEWLTLSAPAIVTEAVWDQAQTRTAFNRSHKGGRPASIRRLSGRLVCPDCGGGMRYVPAQVARYEYYTCHRHVEARRARLENVCEGGCYRREVLEDAVTLSLTEIAEKPEAVRAQLAVYSQEGAGSKDDARREMAALDKALTLISRDEGAAVQAQIAGIRAGASPDAYAAVFADLAARRKDMEARRGTLQKTLTATPQKAAGRPSEDALRRQGLADLTRVLTSPEVPETTKRDLIGTVIEKVICRKDGAEIVYLPGIMEDTAFGDTVQGVSTPQPRNTNERPPASTAPRCACVSTPRAPPETTVSPCAVSSLANCRARVSP